VLFYIPNHGHPRQLSFCESVVRLGSIIESPRSMGLICGAYLAVLVFFTHWPRFPEVVAGPTGLPLDKVGAFRSFRDSRLSAGDCEQSGCGAESDSASVALGSHPGLRGPRRIHPGLYLADARSLGLGRRRGGCSMGRDGVRVISTFFGARGKWGSQQSHGTVIRCEFLLLARAALSDGGYSRAWLFAETRA